MNRFTKTTRKLKCKRCGKSELGYHDNLKKVNVCFDCFEDYKKSKINCTSCRTKFKREEEYFTEDSKYKTKNFCSEKCYNNYISEQEEKDKMDKWLKEYFKSESLPNRIYMQMEDFKNKKNISYKWTFATLRYIVKIKGQNLQEGSIGLVPYVVDECREHVASVNKAKKLAKESDKYKAKFSGNEIIIKEIDINKERERYLSRTMVKESDLEGIVW